MLRNVLEIECVLCIRHLKLLMNDFFPKVATFKVLVYCTLFIRPAVLFSAVEECRFRLANVCFGAARTGVAIYKTRVTEEWYSILIRCEE